MNVYRRLALLLCAALTLSVTGFAAAPTPAAAMPCWPGADGSGDTLAAAKIKVWLAGDSTVADPRGGCPVGWGSQFQSFLTADATVQNNAVAGRSIQTWMFEGNVTGDKDSTGECVVSPSTFSPRWAAMLDATTGMHAGDFLFIQFGINDSDPACPRHVGTARYQQLLGVMAQAAKARGATPILVTPVAAITCSGSTAVGNRGFITETKNAAAANDVPVIDLNKSSIALYNSLQLCPNNGDFTQGAVGAFFCNDHTHFETAGAKQIAGLIATAVRDQKIDLATDLR